jgi:hypothetical protein
MIGEADPDEDNAAVAAIAAKALQQQRR